MEPVRGRRVSRLRANLSEFFGTPTVQGEPFHIIYGSPVVEGVVQPVVQAVQVVQQVAQAEREAEFQFLSRYIDAVYGNNGPYQGG